MNFTFDGLMVGSMYFLDHLMDYIYVYLMILMDSDVNLTVRGRR